jgi:hypothetical protein
MVIDPSTMLASGSSLKMGGFTFKVGLQGSISSLKSVGSGLPAGVFVSGESILVRQAGTVLEGYDLRGYSVAVQANNVTIKNNLFNATGQHTVLQGASYSGMVVEFNTFDGAKANNRVNIDMVLNDNTATIRNNEFFNLPSDAINTVGGTVENNYLAGASYQVGAHADAISIHRTVAPIMIRGNYIDYVSRSDAPQGTNAAIKIVSHFGTISDVTVDANVLLGGGYTIYAGPDKYAVSNVTFTGNDVGLGKYGALMEGNHGASFTYSNGGGIVSSSLAAAATTSAASGAAPATGTSIRSPATPVKTITGTDNQDGVHGTDGKDIIQLKKGADVVQAHGGNDTIIGGGGKDWMAGQSGNDVFVYASAKDSRPGAANRDIILDFGFGKDKIDLHLIDANARLAGDQAFAWIGSKAYSGHAGELRCVTTGSHALVGGDVNGDGKADFQIEIWGPRYGVAATDFHL